MNRSLEGYLKKFHHEEPFRKTSGGILETFIEEISGKFLKKSFNGILAGFLGAICESMTDGIPVATSK